MGRGFKMLKPRPNCRIFAGLNGSGSLPCHARPDGPHGDGALQPLALHIAAEAVRFFYVAVDKQVRGGTAAAAIEPRPAVLAVGPGVDVQHFVC